MNVKKLIALTIVVVAGLANTASAQSNGNSTGDTALLNYLRENDRLQREQLEAHDREKSRQIRLLQAELQSSRQYLEFQAQQQLMLQFLQLELGYLEQTNTPTPRRMTGAEHLANYRQQPRQVQPRPRTAPPSSIRGRL